MRRWMTSQSLCSLELSLRDVGTDWWCRGTKSQTLTIFQLIKYFVSAFFSSAGCTTHRIQEVNGLAFAGAAEACGWDFLLLLVLPALASVQGLRLSATNPSRSEGQSHFCPEPKIALRKYWQRLELLGSETWWFEAWEQWSLNPVVVRESFGTGPHRKDY